MYQYIWFGDIYDTEAEKTLTLHMPAQVIACPPLSHRLVYLFFCLFAWTPTLHMPGQVIAKSQLIFSWYVARQMGETGQGNSTQAEKHNTCHSVTCLPLFVFFLFVYLVYLPV